MGRTRAEKGGSTRGSVAARCAIPAVGGAIFAILAFVRSRDPGLYDSLFWAWGAAPFWPPFIDLHGVLSSVVCHQFGIDVYHANPCDVLGRVYNYSPLILGLSVFHVTYDWIWPGGLVLTGLFLIALASLPQPRGAFAWTVTLLASFSTMSIFALERQNFDVAIFLLVVAAGHLLLRRRTHGVGYALAILAAVLKLYPFFLLFAALRERRAIFIAVIAGAVASFALMVALFRDDLARAAQHIPVGPYFTDLFGAKNLPDGLASLIAPFFGADFQRGGPIAIVAWIVLAILLIDCARRAARIAANPAIRARFAALPPAESVYLCLGGIVIVGCFFGAQNVGYRGIFFLLALPGLLWLARDRQAPGRVLAARAAMTIVFLMWGECFREAIDNVAAYYGVTDGIAGLVVGFWLLRELLWWWIVGNLIGLLACFALDSPLLPARFRSAA